MTSMFVLLGPTIPAPRWVVGAFRTPSMVARAVPAPLLLRGWAFSDPSLSSVIAYPCLHRVTRVTRVIRVIRVIKIIR